jgi:hypothetical protein
LPGAALAATGWVSGTTWSLNQSGNYCPNSTGVSCAGTRYPQASYNILWPVPNVVLEIRDNNNAQIGVGSTQTSGSFLIKWTGTASNPNPTQVYIRWFAHHKDNVFRLTHVDGTTHSSQTPWINVASGSTQSNPQNLGNQTLSSGSADPYWNAYFQTEWQWRQVFAAVGAPFTGTVTNIEMRGFQNNQPSFMGNKPSSAADSPNRRIQLDTDAAMRSQARSMHEFGHIANYWQKTWTLQNSAGICATCQYDWDGNSWWSQDSYEWGVAGFEEAFATHHGSTAFWLASATAPTTCNANTTCYSQVGSSGVWAAAPTSNIEATSHPDDTNNCVTTSTVPEARQPVSHMRFLWDVFDNNVDGPFDTYSSLATGAWTTQAAIFTLYASGTGTNKLDEPWNSGKTAVTEKDGRGSASFMANYASIANVSTLRTRNCSPP